MACQRKKRGRQSNWHNEVDKYRPEIKQQNRKEKSKGQTRILSKIESKVFKKQNSESHA
jgi:Skp family chaperone for outer membrane proteins